MTDHDVIAFTSKGKVKACFISDNLELMAYKTGRKVFFGRVFFNGKQHRFRLGEFPLEIASVAIAQTKRQSYITLHFTDNVTISPTNEDKIKAPSCTNSNISLNYSTPLEVALDYSQQTPYTEPKTLGECFFYWYEVYRSRVCPKMAHTTKRRFERFILPHFANIRVDMITAPMAISVFRRLNDIPDIQKRTIGIFNSLLDFAISLGVIQYNPCKTIGNVLIRRVEFTPRPTIQTSELPKLLHDFLSSNHIENITKLLFLFSLASLLRPKENTGIMWSDINSKTCCIQLKASVMKMRKPHEVPITPFIQKILNELKILAGKSPFLFPTTLRYGDRNTQTMSSQTVNHALGKIGYKGKQCSHGFRALGRTWLAENNIPFDVAELMLAHSIGNSVTSCYIRTNRLEERRLAQHQWCNFIIECDKYKEIDELFNHKYEIFS